MLNIGKSEKAVAKRLGKFLAKCDGNIAIMMALSAPALMAAGGIATDYAAFSMKVSNLQAAADASALAAAKELGLASSQDTAIIASAQAYLKSSLSVDDAATIPTVTIDRTKGTVQVALSEDWTPFFASFINAGMTPVKVSATGALAGETKVCILALATGPSAFNMQGNAHVQATGCGVYANSTDTDAIYLGNSSTIDAALLCSGGGIFGKGYPSYTNALTDCPGIPDPLASRTMPTIGACNHNKLVISSGTQVLAPGVYCGGLEISGSANVTFSSGSYVIKDGLFNISGNGVAKGKDISFFLSGNLTMLSYTGGATIDFSGAETGNMAGLLFFEDPNASTLRVHEISAANAYNLTGTIYLPRGILMVDPIGAAVGQNSAYTAIIANRVTVQKGPSLVLNTDYSVTNVPVPSGIRSGATVVLQN